MVRSVITWVSGFGGRRSGLLSAGGAHRETRIEKTVPSVAEDDTVSALMTEVCNHDIDG